MLLQLSFFLIYQLFLRNEIDFARMRAYLSLSLVLSFIIPFLEVEFLNTNEIENSSFYQTLYLAPISINETTNEVAEILTHNSTNGLPFFNVRIITVLYFSGAISLILLQIIGIWKLWRIIKDSKLIFRNGNYFYMNDNINYSFNFFRKVVIQSDSSQHVLMHELSHLKHLHYLDNMIFLLNKTILWFSPVSWFLHKECKLIHEYQADREVIKKENITEYKQTLIQTTLASIGMGLASSFHDGALLKRLKIMTQKTRKISSWKWSGLVMAIVVTCTVFACSTEVEKELDSIAENSYQISYEELRDELKSKINNPSDFIYLRYVYNQKDGLMEDGEHFKQKIEKLDESLIAMVDLEKNNNENGSVTIVLAKNKEIANHVTVKLNGLQEDVFTVVDDRPEFPGGMNEFYAFVGSQIKYPEEARKLGIEGQVFVQFIVDKKGNVKDVNIVKGLDEQLDKIAAAAVASSPKFIPGKQNGIPVNVKMVLPVAFSLNKE